tara:strand:- start:219 stop:620 length:402 start_codon:yes stop_codon:yes gene_type:complete
MFEWIKRLVPFNPKPTMAMLEAQQKKNERYYQFKCNEVLQGQVEKRMSDNTRVDILTEDLAIEVDFARKWYEAIGQAAHYANLTGRKPAILLIVRERSEEKYILAASRACKTTKVRLNGDDYHVTMLVYRDFA